MPARPGLKRHLATLPLAALFALAACGTADDTTNTAENAALADYNETLPLDEATDEPVAIAELPVVTATTAAAAPVAEAIEEAAAIEQGTGVTRVANGEGWAWMREGRIIRTASRDGKDVAYFRRGEETPYLVQRDGRAYATQGGRVTREFDRDGKSQAPTPERVREGQQLVEGALRGRDRAESPRGGRDEARPTPTPTPTATPRQGGDRDRDEPKRADGNRPDPAVRPIPTPTPAATRTPRADRDGRPEGKEGERR